MRYVVIAVLAAVVLFGLDFYVYRNWRRFAHHRRWARRYLSVYRLLMVLMPVTMPLYFYFSRWWEVEPKLARAAFIGAWAIYYVPKILISLGLLIKDFARFIIWLFGWFQQQLLGSEPEAASRVASPVREDATVGAPSLDLADMKHLPRREFLTKMGWSAASIPFVLVGYGVFRTLYDYEVYRIDVPISGLPKALDGLRIVQLSDLHAGSFFSSHPMQEAVEITRSLRPDLVLVTGDFVNHDAAEMAIAGPALSALKADLGVYGCLGNHDHYARWQDVANYLKNTPVDLLINEHRSLLINGTQLNIVGTDNTGFNQRFADLPRALEGIDPDIESTTLLLAHDPTFWDQEVRHTAPHIDLMLSGHTHGGQIGLEMGPLRWSLARVVYKRWAGLYQEKRADGGIQQLYVNRGLGTVGPPLRLGIRPEITELTLRCGNESGHT